MTSILRATRSALLPPPPPPGGVPKPPIGGGPNPKNPLGIPAVPGLLITVAEATGGTQIFTGGRWEVRTVTKIVLRNTYEGTRYLLVMRQFYWEGSDGLLGHSVYSEPLRLVL